MKFLTTFIFFTVAFFYLTAQTTDTIKQQALQEVTIKSYRFPQQELSNLPEVQKAYINSGKKNEVIQLDGMPANIVEKTGRQLFAKIPGVFVYDMDGSGNQINIATRGLDPHRSWEFNVRQNGVMTNSDVYGYPASHYSPPMEAIQKIELIRGTASLQYGAQFGGMIDFITKQADTTKAFSFENVSSVGSYGLFSTYNAIGGKVGKWSYYAYYQRRVSDGYRDNASSNAQAQFGALTYHFTPNMQLKAEIGRSQYIYQIPGPLTDELFQQNPRQSTRTRNFYEPDIYVPSLTYSWQINAQTSIDWISSAVLGSRNSVQFIGLANIKDEINPNTLQFSNRQVDIDKFNSYTSELRLTHHYEIGKVQSTLAAGFRYINNDLHRRQVGKGTTGNDYDLTVVEPNFRRDIRYKTENVAFSVENLFRLNQKLQVSPGFRIENGTSRMRGVIAYLPEDRVPNDIEHKYALLGVSAQYQMFQNLRLYGGWSQAYRPVIFSDVIPPTFLNRVDENLKDAFGHNAELGIKGSLSNRLNYDINFFQVLYQNRIGDVVETDAQGETFILRTNIGDSRTNGLEMYVDYKIAQSNIYRFSIFSSTSYMDGKYLSGTLRSGDKNIDLTGNVLETVPTWISRNGLQMAYKQFAAILQYSYVSDSFSDPFNTTTPTPDGARGIVPAYQLWDFNMSYRLNSTWMLRLGVNNFTNEQYFTKRPVGYPGAGVWNSDGRSIVATVSVKL